MIIIVKIIVVIYLIIAFLNRAWLSYYHILLSYYINQKRKEQKMKKDVFMSLDLREMNDLLYLLTYSYSDEKKHWEEEGKPKNHVYHSISCNFLSL